MTDNLTGEQRRKAMRRVKSKDTSPEMKVRRLVHQLGYRYRLHGKDLPGTPDLIFPKLKKVIFVHGCFWHGHKDCPAAARPTSNIEYWNAKLDRNLERDGKNMERLKSLGWEPHIIWECQVKKNDELETLILSILSDGSKNGEPYSFYEFFAGGGMARIGLGDGWNCVFANEWSKKKADAYRENFFGAPELLVKDVSDLSSSDLPGHAVLAWASFPCQDLSLAGTGKGLNGGRSGTFWPFWKLINDLKKEKRAVPIIVLENVVGALTSNKGYDFRALMDAITSSGYKAGPVVIDAVHFLPQSRPRLFVIAVKDDRSIPGELIRSEPSDYHHPRPVLSAYDNQSVGIRDKWIWWNLPRPVNTVKKLIDVIENDPKGVNWHSPEETSRLLGMMSERHLEKVREQQALEKPVVGAIYKRTRKDGNGKRIQRAEVRFDNVSGCLRTPAGGSSRQTVILINGDSIRTRLLSPREAARLMGLDDDYKLPENFNEAYHIAGDGLATPVVTYLENNLLRPLANIIG